MEGERRSFSDETQARLRHAEALLTVSEAVGSTLDLTEVIRRVTREMVRAVGADTGSAWGFDPHRERLVPLAGYHAPKELLETFARSPSPLGYPFIEEFLTGQRAVYASDSQADPRFDHPLLRLLPHKSVLVLPMWQRDQTIGGFIIVWLHAAHQFTPDELRLVETMARHAAMAISNAHLYQERDRFRAVLDEATDAICISDAETLCVLDVNRAECELSGYSREDLIGRDIRQLWPDAPDLRAKRERVLTETLARGVAHGLGLPHRTHSGQLLTVDLHQRLIEYQGRRYIVSIFRDATLRLEAEAARREVEQVQVVQALAHAAAHEIKNPLTVVIGYLEMVGGDLAEEEGKVAERVARALIGARKIEEVVKRMGGITRLKPTATHETPLPMLDLWRSTGGSAS